MGDYIEQPFQALIDLWNSLSASMTDVLEFMSTKVRLGNIANIVELIESVFGVDIPIPTEVSVFSLFVGGSITVFLVLTIVKWIIGIIQ